MSPEIPFHPAVARWFQRHFSAASPPQVQGWPAISAGQHTLILAPTGSGKTLAAFLWCIDQLFRRSLEMDAAVFAHNPDGVHTLYISPLKALNNDIHRNLREPLTGIRDAAEELQFSPPEIRVLVRTGDTPPHVRQSMLRRPPHILITTPESLYLLLTSERGREIFRGLRYLIVDEIHALCDNKRGVHLSLSLERLMTLCGGEPVRIGLSATQRPLERIAAFLGGQIFAEGDDRPSPRPVTIVDCGQRKDLDLQVIAPIADFSDLPEATVWPAVSDKLYELIRAHRSTLVFVNMRAQTERIARHLNELHRQTTGDPEAELALPHHGSISREARYLVEEKLKQGKIPAVIATASLELGIDIGSIDLVVQLESPKSVSSALQRVGRSGHVLHATSKGRIMPMYPADLGDAVALSRAMLAGEIEETTIPENCLDVLAQQIVAEVAMRDWSRPALYRLVRQSYCYRNLSLAAFDNVVEMLAGRFAESPLRALQPRLAWDRVNDQLIGRRGARLQAVLNGNTIPDRGYYTVYMAETNTRLGEMEEEFVFESKVGDIFYLGSSEWRIEKITHDRLLVTPRQSVKPRPPFWKGDSLYRDFSSSLKIGVFRREMGQRLAAGNSQDWLVDACHADADLATNLQAYFERQLAHTGNLPTDSQLIGEWFRDSADEPNFILHAPFGGRVNGAWAVALATALEKRYQVQVQYAFDDHGIIFRALDTTEPFPIDKLFSLSAAAIEQLLVEALQDTPIFIIRFRYNATRALLLPRSQQGRRVPLWLQRLRAADLLQAVRKFPDFPIVLETYRDCLHDVFDLPSLRTVIDGLHRGEIKLDFVHTPYPSPMASGLLFRFLANNLYNDDRSRYTSNVVAVSSELLADILARETIPTIVTAEIVAAAEARWQHLTPETRARTAEDLFAIIEKLGPIPAPELQKRATENWPEWLQALAAAQRLVHIDTPFSGWIASTDAPLFAAPPSAENVLRLVKRFLQSRGPVTRAQIVAGLTQPESLISVALATLHTAKEIVRGKLIVDVDAEQWCDRHNFAELYRRAVAARRETEGPADRQRFYGFLLCWHRLGQPTQSLAELVQRYAGYGLPLQVFEREILRSRLLGENAAEMPAILDSFKSGIARGEFIVRASRNSEEGRRNVDFILRNSGHVLSAKSEVLDGAAELPDPARAVLAFLQENGASQFADLCAGTGLARAQVQDALAQLANGQLVSCDNYSAFMLILSRPERPTPATETEPGHPPAANFPARFRPAANWRRSRTSRDLTRHDIREQMPLREGRWFLTSSFAVHGKEIDVEKRIERQARLLLQRYGILVKEWYRREQGLLPWHRIFQALKKLEWQGEIRRGYFVDGLSGIQFALPEAVELLQSQYSAHLPAPVLLSTVDPALPFAGADRGGWDLHDREGNAIAVTRGASNHLLFIDAVPVLYSENFGLRLWCTGDYHAKMAAPIASALKIWLQLPPAIRPRKRLEIQQFDAMPATAHPLAEIFLQNGFERSGEMLVLWPSGV